ncbi:MAG: DUF4124 domain-containing protein [Nitrospinales bacterium]
MLRKQQATIVFMSLLTAILSFNTTPSYAGVYKWVDETGKTHYTDSPAKIPREYRDKKSVKVTPSQSSRKITRNYKIPNKGSLKLSFPGSWKDNVRYPQNSLPPTINFTPVSGKSFEILITPLYPFRKGFSLPTATELKDRVRKSAEKEKPHVKEKIIQIT